MLRRHHAGWALALVLALALPATAHETDQYTVPAAREFADIGDSLTRLAYKAIEGGVAKTNDRIRSAIKSKRSPAQYQTPEEIASAVRSEFPIALVLIESLDKTVNAPTTVAKYPGRIVGYKPAIGVRKYVEFQLNPLRAWQCATIKAYGILIGTDKIGHFTDMGMHYYNAYRKGIRDGLSENLAWAKAKQLGTNDPIFSERGLLGFATAGAYSNADLVANYSGMLFYKNLTEPVMLKGETQTPMLEREGDYWKIAPRVRIDSDFFSLFVSEHYDESLNPSVYRRALRKGIEKAIREHISEILDRHVDRFGNRLSQSYFAAKQVELSTYFGFDYGHLGARQDLLGIADICFDPLPADAPVTARDNVGRTPLHIAAESGNVQAMTNLLSAGAEVNVQVRSDEKRSPEWGNTPLHLAARDGRVEAVKLLLERGALVNARSDLGATALHRAIAYPQIVQMLLEKGADPNIADVCGRTPLHWAAFDPASTSVPVLLEHRADPNVHDHDGETPLHRAAHAGNLAAIGQLIAKGAQANATDKFGTTPLHIAALHQYTQIVSSLIRAGASSEAQDDFGIPSIAAGAIPAAAH